MKTRSWKTLLVTILAVAGMAFTMAPPAAEAGHGSSSSRYSHRCGSCNTPVYQRLAVVGYTRCGDPIYRWVTVTHRCSHRSQGHGYSGHSHGSSHLHPHDVIFGILNGIINAHQDHRRRHFGH